MTDKQKFYRLLSYVCEKLPTSAINALVQRDYPLGAVSLMQVRQGRTINLPALLALVQVGMPDFAIPEELLPAEPVADTVPLFQS